MSWNLIAAFILTIITPTFSQSVRIYSQSNFAGNMVAINISSCVPTLSPLLSSLVNSINTQGNCAQLYSSPNCEGPYLIAKPGTQHEVLNGYGWANKTQSVGPCHPKCHEDNVQTPKDGDSIAISPSKYVQLYRPRGAGIVTEEMELTPVILRIPSNSCVDTPTVIKNEWTGVLSAVLTVKTSTCVEAYLKPGCQGPSYRLTLGSVPSLSVYNFQLRLDQFGSFSWCGYDCKRDGKKTAITPEEEAQLHAAYLCGMKDYKEGHECHNVTKALKQREGQELVESGKIETTTVSSKSSPVVRITSTWAPHSDISSNAELQYNTQDESGSNVLLIFAILVGLVVAGVVTTALFLWYKRRSQLFGGRQHLHPKRGSGSSIPYQGTRNGLLGENDEDDA